jgi:hypothetical protein
LLSIVRDAQNILFTRLSKVPLRQLEKKESEVIAARLESLRSSGLSELSAVIGRFLNLGELFGKPTSGRGSRDRIFSTQVTFWAFLHQVLTRNMACRDAVRKVQAMRAERGLPIPSEKSDAYCQARIRLPTSKLLYAHAQLVTWLGAHTRKEDLWLGHDVKVVDGTGVSMPDTADNQARWPQTASQEPGCGFPQAKLVGCFSLASAGLLAWTLSNKNHHESKSWRDMWDIFKPGDIALTDRGFNSYDATAQLKIDREVDSVMRLHQRRKVDFRKGRRLGDHDRIQTWLRPQRPAKHFMTKEQWAELPKQLEVRIIRMQVQVPGFRTSEITLVTTLLDEKKYPASAICELYLKRWRVELYFRDIKVTLGLDVLRCKTPDMVEKEIAMHAVTYNAIRAIMQEAAATHHSPLERLSFKGTVDTLREWASIFSMNKPMRRREQLYDQMLGVIARDQVPERPHRSEPRAKKRRPKTYQLMTAPRGQMKVSKSRRNK